MRRSELIAAAAVVAVLMLVCMAVPAAAASYDAPTGTRCTTSGPSICWLIEPTDAYAQQQRVDAISSTYGWWSPLSEAYTLNKPATCVKGYASMTLWRANGAPTTQAVCVFVGGEWADHTFERYLFPDVPAEDRAAFEPARMVVTELRAIAGAVIDRPSVTITTGSTLAAYCDLYGARDASGQLQPGIAVDRAPAGAMTACRFTRRVSEVPVSDSGRDGDVAVEREVESDIEQDRGGIAAPQGMQSCGGLVVVRAGRVQVHRRGVDCVQARRVLSRFVRDRRQSRGWACRRISSRARFTVRCVARASARSIAVGTWARPA